MIYRQIMKFFESVHLQSSTQKHRFKQSGMALIEPLAAMLVMAVGVLSVLGIQMRSAIENQSAVHRVQAVRLIENLAERLHAHPNAMGYVAAVYSTANASTASERNCQAEQCTGRALAQYDVVQWFTAVQATLPAGGATLFVSENERDGARRQLGVLLSWRMNERVVAADDETKKTAYTAPFVINQDILPAAVSCPEGNLCHLQYIALPQRCGVFSPGNVDAVVCTRTFRDKNPLQQATP